MLSNGILTGCVFPIVSKDKKDVNKLYKADFIGASIGSLLISIFFIPLIGISRTLIIINLILFIAFLISK